MKIHDISAYIIIPSTDTIDLILYNCKISNILKHFSTFQSVTTKKKVEGNK
jgi:hypothetical protein